MVLNILPCTIKSFYHEKLLHCNYRHSLRQMAVFGYIIEIFLTKTDELRCLRTLCVNTYSEEKLLKILKRSLHVTISAMCIDIPYI